MSYKKWYESHAQKHAEILKSLSHLSKEEVIEYFDFDNMKIKHPEFCPLYPKDQKCHDIESLNCYFCACMHFRFDDNSIKVEGGKRVYSYCSIESKNSATFETKDSIHNDCSNCKVPHKAHVIKKYFDRDWRVVMQDCDISED
ncbi:hypothetical protein MNB_SV-6-371 [hydrothermal vent metagenome]|uniref:Uncharacterized protein n=1 Tax=hydrothermal vent metagenome TaxID=652676 RepID=A0A1W1C932_9ZZZZ